MVDSRGQAPKAFLSYAWEDEAHKEWVRRFAERLRSDGVETHLDQWAVQPGDQIAAFMEKAVRENDFVLIICTPKYKRKADDRQGGVGYEGDIMTAEVFYTGNRRKFIPILRRGEIAECLPAWLSGSAYIDMRGEAYQNTQYNELLRALRREWSEPPPVRPFKPMEWRSPREVFAGLLVCGGGSLTEQKEWRGAVIDRVVASLKATGFHDQVERANPLDEPFSSALSAGWREASFTGGFCFDMNASIQGESVDFAMRALYDAHVRPPVEALADAGELEYARNHGFSFRQAVFYRHDELLVMAEALIMPGDDLVRSIGAIPDAHWQALRWVENHGVNTSYLGYTIRLGNLVKHPKTVLPTADPRDRYRMWWGV